MNGHGLKSVGFMRIRNLLAWAERGSQCAIQEAFLEKKGKSDLLLKANCSIAVYKKGGSG
jgi:hypothetical protein